ncbi:lipoprotein signal peptidase [Salinisphaera sp. USBA-960]|uniref:signal peptidase II n=1 Tax=Salinisphaera orenii TaxID=856731 RepID=UPI000DBE6F16|nr:lipoprotein signal peptidase [Salifodinibacter halophilus]NNC25748.1 lipoprotein signal peptidase [Salifodinibacter halophilus]
MSDSGSSDSEAPPRVRNVQWLWLAVAIIVLDQVAKQLVITELSLYRPLTLTSWLNITLMHNTGAAFSIFSEASPWMFAVLAVAVAAGILVWLWRHPFSERLSAAALALIAGGALANAIDRVTRGHVVDFIDFHIGAWHYPAFNIADSAIVIGALGVALAAFLPARQA